MIDSEITPPGGIPDEVVNRLRASSDRQLRDVVHYARALLYERHSPTSEIEPREGEEIVRVDDHGASTAVTVERSGESGETRGPFVYRVRYEPAIDGDDGRFGWHYLGRVEDGREDG